MPDENVFIFITEVKIKRASLDELSLWQAKFNEIISSQKGFVSLEILNRDMNWCFVQRFASNQALNDWKTSETYKKLILELDPYVIDIQAKVDPELKEVTEVFITQVNPDKVDSFKNWIGRIHQIESLFPGFKGVYVQSPQKSSHKNWITLLRFDNAKNLNYWLDSRERKEILKDSESIVDSLENHTIASPYSGWFNSIIHKGDVISPTKQTMLVLLVLFPIVVFEMKYLNPYLVNLNPTLATFIGNAISVSLITWPFMPFAIKGLNWWITAAKKWTHYLGFAVVIGLYLLEIALLWNFLKAP